MDAGWSVLVHSVLVRETKASSRQGPRNSIAHGRLSKKEDTCSTMECFPKENQDNGSSLTFPFACSLIQSWWQSNIPSCCLSWQGCVPSDEVVSEQQKLPGPSWA